MIAGVAYIDLPVPDKKNRFTPVAVISPVCYGFEAFGPADPRAEPAWNSTV
jgi:hypothetical protein